MKKLLTFAVLLLLLTSCHSTHEEQQTIRQTVIVYISGENSLSGNINSDLNELTEGSKAMQKDERLVAFVDNYSLPYIIEIRDGARDTIKTFKEDFYASDPEKFYETIHWIENEYPAENNNYGLVLWGHASGWLVQDSIVSTKAATSRPKRAYGQDEGTNLSYGFGTRWMNITQMRQALERLPKFKYILADCCCFLSVESAYELRHVADYLIGSPAEIPAAGAPYNLILSDMFGKSDDFYKGIVDKYFNYYYNFYSTSPTIKEQYGYLVGNSVPLAVVDTKEMEELAQATRSVLKAPEDFTLDSIPYYLYLNNLASEYEMGIVMKQNLSEENYAAWKAALDKAVPYKLNSAKWMSIYRPLQTAFLRDSFLKDDEAFSGLNFHIPLAMYNFNAHYNLKSFEWYTAVGWNRYE